jgi:hypothetical protein
LRHKVKKASDLYRWKKFVLIKDDNRVTFLLTHDNRCLCSMLLYIPQNF